jgi:hypothetical protein
VAGFGAFFGLATMNVVGVTATGTATGPGGASGASVTTSATLPPGDFFGVAGVAVRVSSGSQAIAAAPQLRSGGGRAVVSSRGS